MRRARKRKGRKIAFNMSKKLKIALIALLSVFALFTVILGFHEVFFPYGIDNSALVPLDKQSGRANMLILGVDKDGLRTDTIIVASYDLDNGKIDMLSIPRDTRMYVGRGYQKINAAHALRQNGNKKGVNGTIEAVTRLTGIPINYYIEFTCEAFRKTVDAFGGVEFDVPERMYYTDKTQDLYIDLEKGLQLLDGDKAEQLVRFRKYADGDIGRVKVQQDFVKEFARQHLSVSSIKKIPGIYKTLQEEYKTNLTVMEIAKYIPNLKDLSTDNITMYQLPGEFSGAGYAASYWLCDIPKTRELIETVFGYDASKITTGPKGSVYSGEDRVKVETPKPTESPKATEEPEITPKISPDVVPDNETDYIEIPEIDESPDVAEPLPNESIDTDDNIE